MYKCILGHETTAHTLSFIIYALAVHPVLQQWAHNSMDVYMASDSTEKDKPSSLPPYIEAVIKEAMRRYPTVSGGSLRVVKDPKGIMLPIKINNEKDKREDMINVHIPQGTWLLAPFYAIQNCTANWGLDALAFDPSRWMGKDNEEESNRFASPSVFSGTGKNSSQISFAPFSHGIRNCLGMNLALLEIRTAIGALVKKFHFELADQRMVNEENALETFFTMRPKQSMPVKVYLRSELNCSSPIP